ncbi:MAG TPA: MBL fold metallo-hydrolase [Ktedonobacterales bacterium]|nr:MBL fold metallo-hydrolase [Ktedonobacterales bacterium]
MSVDPQAPFHFALGSISIHILNDGIFHMDGGSAFGRVPRVLWEKVVAPDHLNRVPMAMNSLLLESDGKLIVIETGYGDKLTEKQMQMFGIHRPQGSLLDQLATLGVHPEDIDMVVNTHLHGDHAGWNTRRPIGDAGGESVPTFPNARYVTQRLEWEEAAHPNELTAPGYPDNNFAPLQTRGVLDLVEGEVRLTPDILLVPTPGHTAGHQSVWVESGGSAALFTGDAALHGSHLERVNWVGAVDNLPIVSVATKRRLVEEIMRRRASVVVTHHPFPGLGILVAEEGQSRPRFQEVGASG